MAKNIPPLADRMRPKKLQDFFGQKHLIGKGKILENLIKSDRIPSLLFWGPPGSGKTTLANIIANEASATFKQLSATSSGVRDIRNIIKNTRKENDDKKIILFIDEIHRFSKSQQDAFLPSVESGTIILIGATTENPSFKINNALLSRCQVFVLKKLKIDELLTILNRALKNEESGFGKRKIKISRKNKKLIASLSNGDARILLNTLEIAINLLEKNNTILKRNVIQEAFQELNLLYDRSGDEHFNIISAFHKSMRGGDANAALYWLGRMLMGGEDPLYIARRIIRFASEDIGLANSFALPQAISAYNACRFIGMPECGVNLAQATVYMARSKKSITIYEAYDKVMKDIKKSGNLSVPLHLRNSSTKLMKDLGYGKEYKYTPKATKKENREQIFLPKEMQNKKWISFK